MALLIAFLLVQNIAISGTLKDADGKSLAGVRVAVMPVAGNSVAGATTNTDKYGRYTLELPPGDYYIVAGNLSWPTYYTANGSRVVISTSRNGIDFVVDAASLKRIIRVQEAPPSPRRQGPVQWDVPPTPPKIPRWPH